MEGFHHSSSTTCAALHAMISMKEKQRKLLSHTDHTDRHRLKRKPGKPRMEGISIIMLQHPFRNNILSEPAPKSVVLNVCTFLRQVIPSLRKTEKKVIG